MLHGPLIRWLAALTLALFAGWAAAQMPEWMQKLPNILKPKKVERVNAVVSGSDKPLSSVVIDKKCDQLVAPFELTGNLGELTALAAQTAIENLVIEQRVVAGRQHKISAKVRQAAQRMNWLPMATERAIGDNLHAQEADVLERDKGDAAKAAYDVADKILADALAQVKGPHEYMFQIFVLKNSGRNAKALPGGYLYVDYPLVKDPQFQGKAYFAVAHEIAHVLQRHETRAMQARIIDTVSLTQGLPELLKLMGTARSEPGAIVKVAVASKETFARFHSDQELQSDACAVRVLSDALSNKTQLVASLRQFVDDLPKETRPKKQAAAVRSPQAVDMEELNEFVLSPLNRHPTTAERVKLLNEMLAEVSRPTQGRN